MRNCAVNQIYIPQQYFHVKMNHINSKKLIATEKCPFIAYYDTEAMTVKESNGTTVQHIIAYAYAIINEYNKIVVFREGVLQNNQSYESLAEEFLDKLDDDYSNMYKEYSKTWNSSPILTKDDERKFQNSTNCEMCDVLFTTKKPAVRHHRWNLPAQYNDETGVLIKGNYIGALCQPCNLKISLQNIALPVFAHNGGKYDTSFVISGLNSKNFELQNLLSKSGENFMAIVLRSKKTKSRFNFIDSYNFINTSLEKIVEGLRESKCNFEIFTSGMHNFGYDENVISKTAVKGVFPYEFIDSLDKLKYKGLPSKNKFYSSLKESHITQEDYAFALQVYDEAKCNNLESYMRLYLRTDVLLLCESFQQFRSQMYSAHHLDPAYFITLPSFGMEAALYNSKTKLQLLTDIDAFTTFESQIMLVLIYARKHSIVNI